MKIIHYIVISWFFAFLFIGCASCLFLKDSPSNNTTENTTIVKNTTTISSVEVKKDIIRPVNGLIAWKNINWFTTNGGRSAPGNNYWNGSAIWVDTDDNLHLTIRKVGKYWQCTNIESVDNYTYGTYTWKVKSPLFNYSKNSVVGLFLYENDTQEIDIEATQWGAKTKNRLWYSVQPVEWKNGDDIEGNTNKFKIDTNKTYENTTHQIVWQPTYIQFKSWDSDGNVIGELNYTNLKYIPSVRQHIIMNFWLFGYPQEKTDMELIISDFSYSK
jgi:hypothetical protein